MELDRHQILLRLRPFVKAQIAEIEGATGLEIRFEDLPTSSEVLATYAFNPHANTATIAMRDGSEDVDFAHELLHMRLELIDGYNVLAWRSPEYQTPERYATMRTLRAFTDDEVVHNRLVAAGFRLDGEVIRPQLFTDRCVNVPKNLRAAKSLKNDGMSHQDRFGCGDLYRAMLFVQCHLLRTNYAEILTPERLELLDDFIVTFRRCRPRQFRKAQRILSTFETYDVQTVEGHSAILRELASLEKADQFMGLTAFKKQNGAYILPFP